ncbi:hypothetical protein D3C81_1257430 [compost metagenome]
MYLRVIRSATMALFLHATFNTAAAQEQVTSATALPAPTTALAPPVIDFTTIPAGTPVAIEIAEALASSTHKRGDVFAITLIEPLLRDGVEYLPQGTHGTGQIVHAAPARGGGAPGELLIAARTLETSQGPLLLRGFKLGATGDDNSGMALGVSMAAGPFAMFIRGREIVIPAGTRGLAKTMANPSPATTETPAQVLKAGSDATAEPAVPPQPDIPVQSKE